MKKRIGFIDVTPTWVGILPTLRALIESGNRKARDAAWSEIRRMAEAVDAANKEGK